MSKGYFDAAKVLDAAKRGETKALYKIGGYIRGSAIRSIRTAKTHARPGEPPKQRGDRPGAKFNKSIIFEVDKTAGAVHIGAAPDSGTKVQKTLEDGGLVKYRLLDVYRDLKHKGPQGAFLALKRRLKTTKHKEIEAEKSKRQSARPFMNPALGSFLSKIPDQFKNII